MIESNITFCISTYNNLNYLKIAIDSVRKNSYFKDAPFIIYAENCTDGTNEWLKENKELYNLSLIIEPDNKEVKGIGGGMNICAENVQTKYIMFLHSDFYVTKNWDLACYEEIIKHEKPTWVFSHRVEPNIFGSDQRPGTVIVPKEEFGAYYNDFNSILFDEFAKEFVELNEFTIPKTEGVSGIISKKDWDFIGGNDPIFAPASWEDMDLFLRMLYKEYNFVLTSKSLVWHFGARGSHRLEENNGGSSKRQIESEYKNKKLWIQKWGKFPIFDNYGTIKKW
jgi:glycosyltransferase involved in cell wall biosynthesis